jgi:hypothetical protein
MPHEAPAQHGIAYWAAAPWMHAPALGKMSPTTRKAVSNALATRVQAYSRTRGDDKSPLPNVMFKTHYLTVS